MTETEMSKVIKSIDEHHKKIVSRLNRNACIYGAILLIVLFLVWRVYVVGRAVVSAASLNAANTTAIAEVKANQDLYRQQYLAYIKDMIKSMNAFQQQNQGIDVPKAPVPRSPLDLSKPINENDLRRIPQDGPPKPTPTPVVKTKTKTVVRFKTPKRSTPKPVRWPWDAP